MPYQLAETIIESFSADWRPSWTGSNRIFAVAEVEGSPEALYGYGTDGTVSFQVKLFKDTDLQPFRDLMAAEGAFEVLHNDVIIPPPPFPNATLVQEKFDDYYGLSKAA
jgi:hypothetical protein